MSKVDLHFLETMTRDVIESSRIYPGQSISDDFGPNNSGGTLIRPGGRDAYPAFWIRDYAMAVGTGMMRLEEQKHMLLLTANTQCDQTWITKGGSLIPFGAIADHIRIDDNLPVYFPGTYSVEDQGIPRFGTLPPFGDQFFFIHMAYEYVKQAQDSTILKMLVNGTVLIERLLIAFNVVPSDQKSELVQATETIRGVDFGFRDVIEITGDLCYPSILKYRAALQLQELLAGLGDDRALSYLEIAHTLKQKIPQSFLIDSGMLRASTGKSGQPDVWATALAIYLDILEGEDRIKASKRLTTAYTERLLSQRGNIRHVLLSDDYSATRVWESTNVAKNTYQNGAYWGTPVGWVAYAIYENNPDVARNLLSEYMAELRENDFRKGPLYGAPYECFYGAKYRQNPVYMTSVASPLIAIRKIQTR